MYNSSTEVIKHYKTAVDDNGEYREYVVYKNNGLFITEVIGWRIKSANQMGGGRDYYREFDNKEEAIEKYDEILVEWK